MHEYRLTVSQKHLDTFGHVNNAEYLRIMEEARWAMLATQGLNSQKCSQLGFLPCTILKLEIRYVKELSIGEKITVITYFWDVEKRISRVRHIIRNEGGELCADAQISAGVMDLKSRKVVRPRPEWLKILQPSETPIPQL